MSLFLELGPEGDKSCAAVCGDQPVITARHVGTVCPFSSFPWTQQADNGRGESAAVGRECEWRSTQKTVLMECLFGAESHRQWQLILRWGLGGIKNEFKWSRSSQSCLNYCWIPPAPTLSWKKALIPFALLCACLYFKHFINDHWNTGAETSCSHWTFVKVISSYWTELGTYYLTQIFSAQ